MAIRVSIPNLNSRINQIVDGTNEAIEREFYDRGLEIGETFVQMCTKYVPWREGNLAGSGRAYKEGNRIRVSWSEEVNGFDVASDQYYNDRYAHTGIRTHEWDEAMLDYEGDVFSAIVEDILTR